MNFLLGGSHPQASGSARQGVGFAKSQNHKAKLAAIPELRKPNTMALKKDPYPGCPEGKTIKSRKVGPQCFTFPGKFLPTWRCGVGSFKGGMPGFVHKGLHQPHSARDHYIADRPTFNFSKTGHPLLFHPLVGGGGFGPQATQQKKKKRSKSIDIGQKPKIFGDFGANWPLSVVSG